MLHHQPSLRSVSSAGTHSTISAHQTYDWNSLSSGNSSNFSVSYAHDWDPPDDDERDPSDDENIGPPPEHQTGNSYSYSLTQSHQTSTDSGSHNVNQPPSGSQVMKRNKGKMRLASDKLKDGRKKKGDNVPILLSMKEHDDDKQEIIEPVTKPAIIPLTGSGQKSYKISFTLDL